MKISVGLIQNNKKISLYWQCIVNYNLKYHAESLSLRP